MRLDWSDASISMLAKFTTTILRKKGSSMVGLLRKRFCSPSRSRPSEEPESKGSSMFQLIAVFLLGNQDTPEAVVDFPLWEIAAYKYSNRYNLGFYNNDSQVQLLVSWLHILHRLPSLISSATGFWHRCAGHGDQQREQEARAVLWRRWDSSLICFA